MRAQEVEVENQAELFPQHAFLSRNRNYCYADFVHKVAFRINPYWADCAAIFYVRKGQMFYDLANLTHRVFSAPELERLGFLILSCEKNPWASEKRYVPPRVVAPSLHRPKTRKVKYGEWEYLSPISIVGTVPF